MEVEQTPMEYQAYLDKVTFFGGEELATAIYRTVLSFNNRLYDEKWNKTQYTKEMFDTGLFEKPNGDTLKQDAINMVIEKYRPKTSKYLHELVEGKLFKYAQLITALHRTTMDQISRGFEEQIRPFVPFEANSSIPSRTSTNFTLDKGILRSQPPV